VFDIVRTYFSEIASLLIGAGLVSIAWEYYNLRKLRFFESYRDLDSKYYRFLELCAEEPSARAWIRQVDVRTEDLSPELRERRILMYEYILAVMEASFVYRDLSGLIKKKRWPLWESFIERYIGRDSFRSELELWLSTGGFDMNKEFESFMRDKVRGFEAKPVRD